MVSIFLVAEENFNEKKEMIKNSESQEKFNGKRLMEKRKLKA